MTAHMTMTASDISLKLGGKTVLHGIDFEARAGELMAIVGPNGTGKTALLRALTGELPYSGRIALNGRDIAGQKPWELAATRGVLPQATQIAFPFTVIEVVRLGLSSGLSAHLSGASETLPLRALERVDLADYAGRFYQELSGGEQQRVQLARVLTQVWEPVAETGPRWLLLDEPVSSLDIAHQIMVMELARDYARAGGGVIAVMHDLNLSAMFADQITIMRAGKVVEQGSPDVVMTDHVLSAAYGCALRVSTPPADGRPYLLPQAAGLSA